MDEEEREAAIRDLFPLVRRIGKRISRVVTAVDLDDLIGEGSLGAIRAVDTFDPTRGTPLETYARRLILGAILNGLRRADPVSERVRRKIRQTESRRYELAQELGRLPTPLEMERADPALRKARIAAHHAIGHSLDAQVTADGPKFADRGADPADAALAGMRRAEIATAIDRLTPRQRDVVRLYYYGELSLHAIGRRLQISPQRASQLHATGLTKLRATVPPS